MGVIIYDLSDSVTGFDHNASCNILDSAAYPVVGRVNYKEGYFHNPVTIWWGIESGVQWHVVWGNR